MPDLQCKAASLLEEGFAEILQELKIEHQLGTLQARTVEDALADLAQGRGRAATKEELTVLRRALGFKYPAVADTLQNMINPARAARMAQKVQSRNKAMLALGGVAALAALGIGAQAQRNTTTWDEMK